jgi:hypothetical protein
MKKKLGAIIWVIGLCLSCSKDANYINFIGLAVFFISNLMILQEAS